FKIALYTSSANLDKNTTAYSTTNEVSGTGYTAGGENLISVTPTLDDDTAVCDFGDVTWSNATFTARGALIYNEDAASPAAANAAVCVLDFGGDFTVSAGTFKVIFPSADKTNAILRAS